MSTRSYSSTDQALIRLDTLVRKLINNKSASESQRSSPAQGPPEPSLSKHETKHAGGLMRVNHTGEVCAQALYQGQAAVAQEQTTRESLLKAAAEERDHLAWCSQRLEELETKPSVFNNAFFCASFAMGSFTGLFGDRVSLGFVHATEEGVAKHLRKHLQILPDSDLKSQLIVQQMLRDEERHGADALQKGGHELSYRTKKMMHRISRIMTGSSYWI